MGGYGSVDVAEVADAGEGGDVRLEVAEGVVGEAYPDVGFVAGGVGVEEGLFEVTGYFHGVGEAEGFGAGHSVLHSAYEVSRLDCEDGFDLGWEVCGLYVKGYGFSPFGIFGGGGVSVV